MKLRSISKYGVLYETFKKKSKSLILVLIYYFHAFDTIRTYVLVDNLNNVPKIESQT